MRAARSSRALRAFGLIVGLILAPPAFGEVLEGKVVGITDGDTFKLLVERRVYKIRIAEIDTPERGQPWASNAKRALADLIFDRTVSVDVTGTSHDRTVGEVWIGDQCVGCTMVRGGHAWAAIGYVKHESLVRLEEEARLARRGLWSLPASTWVEPSREREARRSGKHAPPRGLLGGDPPDPESFSCGTKRYCREMSSCAEARFYLQQCRLANLDGDVDGVPCESLCR